MEFNIYCDESNHLEHDKVPNMVLGAVFVPVEKVKKINTRIREIKAKHGLSPKFEAKWAKISPAKIEFYKDLVDYFFDDDDIHFRAILINKSHLCHKKYQQTHDDFYYKMYFDLLSKLLEPANKYYIYLDIKDTQGRKKVARLWEILSNSMYDFRRDIVKNIQQVRSNEIGILQIGDILIGAMQYVNRNGLKSDAKRHLVERIQERSGYDLKKSTLLLEKKMNIFYWGNHDLI
ncbi:MAG: DUF3800 domain-containing protein [Parcubacteria group bacterium]|jgi:hypothetical protein